MGRAANGAARRRIVQMAGTLSGGEQQMLGAGAESRRQIGWVIVGGLLVGTLFTLFVIPTVYTLVRGRRTRFAQAEAAPQPAE